jgi:aspartyl-tRNA(Asn)/glutamyl-tRNA(Gln) amidotransferase subunit C
MISKAEVQHIAKLARLGLSEKEIEKMQKELSAILDYINLLKEVDISGIEPTFHSVPLKNVTREDKIKKESPKTLSKILDGAPAKENGYIKVREILK